MPMEEILKIEDIDQRTQAIKFSKNGVRDFYKLQDGMKIDEMDKMTPDKKLVHYELWKIPKGEVFTKEVHFMLYECPSAKKKGETKEYTKGVPAFTKVEDAMSWGMSSDNVVITPADFLSMQPLIDEA